MVLTGSTIVMLSQRPRLTPSTVDTMDTQDSLTDTLDTPLDTHTPMAIHMLPDTTFINLKSALSANS